MWFVNSSSHSGLVFGCRSFSAGCWGCCWREPLLYMKTIRDLPPAPPPPPLHFLQIWVNEQVILEQPPTELKVLQISFSLKNTLCLPWLSLVGSVFETIRGEMVEYFELEGNCWSICEGQNGLSWSTCKQCSQILVLAPPIKSWKSSLSRFSQSTLIPFPK